MKKNILFILLFVVYCNLLQAQTATSVNDGNWLSTTTWDCNCIPTAGYSVTITHNVTLNTDYLHSTGTLEIASGGSLKEDGTNRNFSQTGGTINNNGTIEISRFLTTGGATLNNYDTLRLTAFLNAATLENKSNAFMEYDSLTNSGNMVNNVDAFLYADSMLNSGMYINNGIDSAYGFTNSGTYTNNGELRLHNLLNTGILTNENIVSYYNMTSTNSLTNNKTITGINFTNTGSFYNNTSATFSLTDFLNTNYTSNLSRINVYDLATTDGNFENGNELVIKNNFYISSAFDNSGDIWVKYNCYNGDTTASTYPAYLNNTGSMYIFANFWNADTIKGSGSICVADASTNNGWILETVDFCDSTSVNGGQFDLNTGVIGSSVTYCSSSGSCSSWDSPTTGIINTTNDFVRIYPNPSNGVISINSSLISYDIYIYDITGKQVFSDQNNSQLNTQLPAGIYILEIKNEVYQSKQKIIIE